MRFYDDDDDDDDDDYYYYYIHNLQRHSRVSTTKTNGAPRGIDQLAPEWRVNFGHGVDAQAVEADIIHGVVDEREKRLSDIGAWLIEVWQLIQATVQNLVRETAIGDELERNQSNEKIFINTSQSLQCCNALDNVHNRDSTSSCWTGRSAREWDSLLHKITITKHPQLVWCL